MQTIWKFILNVNDYEQDLLIPIGARIIDVQSQGVIDRVCMWAIVRTEADKQHRRFRVFGTGHPLDGHNKLNYIGSTHVSTPSLVWHVFEIVP